MALEERIYILCSNNLVSVRSEEIKISAKIQPKIEVSIAPEFKGSLKNLNITLNFTDEKVVE